MTTSAGISTDLVIAVGVIGAALVAVLIAYGCGYDRAVRACRRDFAHGYQCGRNQGYAEGRESAREHAAAVDAVVVRHRDERRQLAERN